MKALVQRVSRSSVVVNGEVVGAIDRGFTVLLGVAETDTDAEAEWIARKLAGLRLFPDEEGRMNRDLSSVHGEVLLISQFTLMGDCRKGNRPSFIAAAAPGEARRLYELVADILRNKHGLTVETGRFQATMQVEIHNEGPVTVMLDSSEPA